MSCITALGIAKYEAVHNINNNNNNNEGKPSKQPQKLSSTQHIGTQIKGLVPDAQQLVQVCSGPVEKHQGPWRGSECTLGIRSFLQQKT